jgi:hypothetical protein
MTEEEWAKTASIRQMLAFADGRVSERKLRLFLCACCRLAWECIQDTTLRSAIELAEDYADGLVDSKQLAIAHEEVARLQQVANGRVEEVATYAAWIATYQPLPAASVGVADAVIGLAGLVSNREPLLAGRWPTTWVWPTLEREKALLRDIVGNPFRVGA